MVQKLTTEQKDAIENLLAEYDFSKVHALFTIMGWSYFDVEGTPPVGRLRETAERLLSEAILGCTDKTYWVESGHFRATYYPGDRELVLTTIFHDQSVYVEAA